MDKDIIIIGGGPGGYVAAIRAAQLGAKVCLIEKKWIGGTCLNIGCVPTKALYRNAELLNTLKNIDEFGIHVDGYSMDIDKMHSRKKAIIDNLVGGIEQLLKANKVEVIRGEASFKDKNTILVVTEQGENFQMTSSHIIIATGSKPTIPPIEGVDLPGIYTSEELLNFECIPQSLTVIGGGVIGMELACIMNALGTKVNVIEYMDQILGMTDSDISKRMVNSLKKKGFEINVSSKVTKIEKTSLGYVVTAEGKKGEFKVETEKVLLAVGRQPFTCGLNLEAVDVAFDRKGVQVNEHYETNIPGIYAIGDVNGKLMLAHAASHQGIHVAENIMGLKKLSSEVVPACIFVFPEVASVGITEDEAKEKGIPYKVSKFMFGANSKALTLGEGEGFIKVLSSKAAENPDEDILLGIHIMGPHASDLIHEGTLAITNRMKLQDINWTIHAHPTLSEAFAEAVLGLNGDAIHMVSLKKHMI